MPSRASCGSRSVTTSGSRARTGSPAGPGACGTPCETRFDTASITKLFTAVAALQQVDAGAFGLETSAVGYLGLEGTAISPDVTVRHLLTHTSGIGDDADEEAGESYEAIWRERPNYSVLETADFLPQFVHRAPNFAPGQGCRYNNCGYVLLGLMVERATGRPTATSSVRTSSRRRACPTRTSCGWIASRSAWPKAPIRSSTTAGAIVGWKRNIYSYPPIGSPDGGAHVTAADLDGFMRAVRTDGCCPPSRPRPSSRPRSSGRYATAGSEHFGFGPWFRVDDDGTLVFFEKEGINVGVSGLVRHYPGRDLTVVMLSNLEKGVWAPIGVAHEMVIAGAFD